MIRGYTTKTSIVIISFSVQCHGIQSYIIKCNIFLKTNIPKNSNSVGSAEVGIRIFRDLAIKTAHQTINGRTEWSSLLPLITQSYNNRPPYNLEISRSHLFLSPYFHTNVSFLLSPPVQENFGKNGADIIQSTYLKLNKKRKDALTNFKSKYGKSIIRIIRF